MMWLTTLIVLAIVAFMIVKYLKSKTEQQLAEHNQQQKQRLDASAAMNEAVVNDSTASDASHVSDGSAGGTAATVAAATAAGAAAVGSAVATSSSSSTSSSATTGVAVGDGGINSGDAVSDVREMIKILNLDGPDATRLQISREELTALRKGDSEGIPDAASLEQVASRLRAMLA